MDILPFAPCGRKATGTLASGLSAAPSSWAPAATGIVLPSPDAEHPTQHASSTATVIPSPRSSKPAFPCDVPDFVLTDTSRSHAQLPRDHRTGKTKKGRPRFSEPLYWAIHLAIVFQGRSRVVVPDLMLRSALWGPGRAPSNWRGTVLRILQDKKRILGQRIRSVEVAGKDYECPRQCAMHGSGQRHGHLIIEAEAPSEAYAPAIGGFITSGWGKSFMGCLEVFGFGDAVDRSYDWNPAPAANDDHDGLAEEEKLERETHAERLATAKSLKGNGMIAATCFPALLFGSSPRMGLSRGKAQLLKALTRELTRRRSRSGSSRQDNAEVLEAKKGGVHAALLPAGLLQPGNYVGFNGNGRGKRSKYHGSGYGLATWMTKAGRLPRLSPDEAKAGVAAPFFWDDAKGLLKDLKALSSVFGLQVYGWHPKRQEWLGLGAMEDMLRSKGGRRWLLGCRLRIHTGEDYLSRWRSVIAERMGFSSIPGGQGDTKEEKEGEGVPAASLSLDAFLGYLEGAGITKTRLAEEMGVSKGLVSQRLSGSKPWNEAWQARVARWIEKEEDAKKFTPAHY